MSDDLEYNTQTYELNQEGRDFIVTTGLVNDILRVTCREHIELSSPYYMGEFSLSELSSIHKYFMLSDSIESAQTEINKAIERQKCGIIDQGNILKLIIYLIIGTDKSNLTLPLYKQEGLYTKIKPIDEQPKYIGKLEYRGNYPIDEKRISNLETKSSKLIGEQKILHEQLEKLIEQSMKLINETYTLKEDNAKLKERLKILHNNNDIRKNEIIKLKKEDQALKAENNKLNKENKRLEYLLKNKKESNIKDLEENNRKTQMLPKHDSSTGPIARTTKFEKTKIETFVPRPTMNFSGQIFDEDNNDFGDNNNMKNRFKSAAIKHA